MSKMDNALKAQFKVLFDKTNAGSMGIANVAKDEIVQLSATEEGLNPEENDSVQINLVSDKSSYNASIYQVVGMRLYGGTLTAGAAAIKEAATTRDFDKVKGALNLKQHAAKLDVGTELTDLRFRCIGHVPMANAFAKRNSEDKKFNNPVRFANINYAGYDDYQEALDVPRNKFLEAYRSAQPKLLRSGLESETPSDDERMMVPIFKVVD